jgi:hypothetical protein
VNPKTQKMKTFVTSAKNTIKLVVFVAVATISLQSQAQSSNEFNAAISSPDKAQSAKLVSFTAAVNNNKADLKWATSSEINTSHFVIEKSTDGVNFSDAGVFFAYGNATDKTNYSFSDKLNSNQAVVYYRLYSVDNNGKGQYSETATVKTGK